MEAMVRKNMHLPDEVVKLIGNVLHSARFRSETQAVIAMLEGAADRLDEVEGYVYLLTGEKGLKIGTSIQPKVRAKNLKSDLIYCISGDRLTELAAHTIWGRHRISGEWFSDVQDIRDWFAEHPLRVDIDDLDEAGNTVFPRFSLRRDMQRRVNEWCVSNADTETGKMPSFSEGCRQLIEKGLRDAD